MGKLTETSKQSQLRVHQFSERITELGWTADELSQVDTGEDLAVKIFEPEPNGPALRPAGTALAKFPAPLAKHQAS